MNSVHSGQKRQRDSSQEHDAVRSHREKTAAEEENMAAEETLEIANNEDEWTYLVPKNLPNEGAKSVAFSLKTQMETIAKDAILDSEVSTFDISSLDHAQWLAIVNRARMLYVFTLEINNEKEPRL
jgi:hypothetical protein